MAQEQDKKPWIAELPDEDDGYEEERLRRKWEIEQQQKETLRAKRLREEKRRLRAILVLATLAAVFILLLTVLTVNVIIPSVRYHRAEKLLERGAYSEAIIAFRNMNGYKNSGERLKEAIHLQAVTLAGKSEVTYETSDTAPWFSITEGGRLDFHKDYYTGDWNIRIPDVFDGVLVTTLSDKIFAHSTKLVSVTISDCVLEIEEYAFLGCNALIEIELPTHLRSIGNGAFENCTALTRVTFGNEVEQIGASAFAMCKSLTSVTLPTGLKTLGSRAFNTCKALREITLGGSLETIGAYAFSACDTLERLNFRGTKSEWEIVAADSDRLGILDADIVFLDAEG